MRARGWQVLILVGGILAVVGLYGIVSSFMVRNTSTTSIPASTPIEEYYIFFTINVLGGGSLHVEYAATAGTVDVFALTEAQYALYVNKASSEALHAAIDSASGSFDVALPGSGKYFVTIDHGSASEGVAQDVRTTIRLVGIEPAWLLGGLLPLAFGILASTFGVVRKGRAMRMRIPEGSLAPVVPPPTDVTFYADRKPPEPPAPPPPPGM